MHTPTHALAALLPLLATCASALPGLQLPFKVSEIGKQQYANANGLFGRPDDINLEKYTIGQILNYTLYKHHEEHDEATKEIAAILEDHPHHPPLVKLAWVVNRTESIKEYLSDKDVSVTLFAPDDEALTPPHHDHDHDHDHDHEHGRSFKFGEAFRSTSEAAEVPSNHPLYRYTSDEHLSVLTKDHDHGDDDEDRKRKIDFFFKVIVPALLKYHISPDKLLYPEIQDKQTIATSLNQTKDTDVAWRIRASPRVEFLPPPPKYSVALNFYSRIRNAPTLLAKNGVIHLISAPLLPPLTPLDQLLAFPEPFSTLTSAIQQTELDSALAPWLHHHHDDKKHESIFASFLNGPGAEEENEPSTIAMAVLEEIIQEAKAAKAAALPSKDDFKTFPFTIFAPTNRAFSKIPFRIRTFLFSPFGRPYLKKLLQFHVVPQQIFHTDYYLNATRGGKSASVVEDAAVSTSVSTRGLEHLFEHGLFEPSSLGDIIPHFPHGPPGQGPPGRGPPRRGPPGRGPPGRGPPGHGKPDDGHHDKPSNVEVKDYVLPTLWGSAKNESLAVKVYSYRLGFGKGPLVRRIALGHVGQDEHDYSSVYISDGVAWGGAVHVIGSLIRPPFAGHGEHHDHDHEQAHDFGRLFAHGPLGDDLEYFKSLWA